MLLNCFLFAIHEVLMKWGIWPCINYYVNTHIKVDNVAQKLLNEGNYLQSFEEFTKILMKEPKNQKALEGRLSSCLELQLFHRCLKDIEKLSQINPCNTKVKFADNVL